MTAGGLDGGSPSLALRALAETIRQHTQAIAEQNRHIDGLFSAISHDLKGPVVTATALLQSYARDAPPDDRIDRAIGALARVGHFVGRVAALSRAARPVVCVPTDLRALVEEAVAAVPGAPDVRIDGDPVQVMVDSTRIRDALIMLLENAAEHGAIDVSWEVGPDVRIAIVDRGPGFAFDASMLEPFSARNERPGVPAALGIPAAYALIRSCQGGLRIESSPAGTACTVLLEIP